MLHRSIQAECILLYRLFFLIFQNSKRFLQFHNVLVYRYADLCNHAVENKGGTR